MYFLSEPSNEATEHLLSSNIALGSRGFFQTLIIAD